MSGERADEAVVAYDNFEPDEEGLREALTSTGNGYFCTRGAAEWQDAAASTTRAPTRTAATTARRPLWAGIRCSRARTRPGPSASRDRSC